MQEMTMRDRQNCKGWQCEKGLHETVRSNRLRSVHRSLPRSVLQLLVTSFILSRLDYGNATLAGISTYLIQWLQSVMNSAARLVFSSSKFAHITPLLQQLHWLRAPEWIDFKLAVLVYNCLHGTAPSYLVDDLCRTTDLEARRRLRSASLSSLCPTHTAAYHRWSVISSRRSSCLEQSSATCLVGTVTDCFPESAEDSPPQSFFPLTHLTMHNFVVPAQWLVISDTLIVHVTYLLTYW